MFTMYCFFDDIFTVIGNNTMCSKNRIVDGNLYSRPPIIVFFDRFSDIISILSQYKDVNRKIMNNKHHTCIFEGNCY